MRKKQHQDFYSRRFENNDRTRDWILLINSIGYGTLTDNLFTEGHMYEGDLLTNVMDIDPSFWKANITTWKKLYE